MPTTPVHPRATPPPGPGARPKWRRRLKTAVVLAAALQPLVAAAAWGAYVRGNAWREWIGRLSGGAGRRAVATGGLGARAADAPGLAYQGGGRIALGDFTVKIYDPVTRVTLRVDFHLEGDAACDDPESFDAFVKMHHRFVREQVMVSVRNAELEDLTDPDLALLKRSIVARVNLAMGEPFLKSVQLKKFALFESVDRSGFVRHTPDGAVEDVGL